MGDIAHFLIHARLLVRPDQPGGGPKPLERKGVLGRLLRLVRRLRSHPAGAARV